MREPLISQGELLFAPPRRLVRRVSEPVASTVLVRGQEVVFASAGRRQTIDLAAHPALHTLVGGIQLLLAGDLDALRASFRIEFEKAPEAAQGSWTLRLLPRQPAFAEIIESIQFEGQRRVLTEFRIRERGGDRTVMRFSSVDTGRQFSETELAQLFAVPEP